MALTNHERVGKALDLLKAGLAPFVDREIQGALKSGKFSAHRLRDYAEDRVLRDRPISEWDVAGLLKLMWDTWKRCVSTDSGTGGAESCQRVARPPQPMGAPKEFLERRRVQGVGFGGPASYCGIRPAVSGG